MMPGELKWQRYHMDAPMKSARIKFYAIIEKPPGPAAATPLFPGLVLGFRASPDLLSLSSEGKLRWRRTLEAPVRQISMEGTEGGAFVALSGGLVCFLSPSGAPKWKYRLGPEVTALAASERGRCAAVADEKGRLACLGVDGKPLWSARLEAPARALRLSQDGSTALALDASGGVSLVSQGGRVLWRRAHPEGVRDIASTAGVTRALVLAGRLRSITLDGGEAWAEEVPGGTSAIRMSEDGEVIYAVGPRTVARFGPSGKQLWLGDMDSSPTAASVMPRTKLLLLPFQGGAAVVDKWGNLVLECPVPVACASDSLALYDGAGTIFCVGEAGSSTHLFTLDVGPSLVDYLLRAARALGDECAKVGQESPVADRTFLEAMEASASADLARALRSAEFSYRYYEEALSSTQRSSEGVVSPETLASLDIKAREALERPLARRRPVLSARCFCGATTPVFMNERPFLSVCQRCGKLGLVR
ncbi:MAG: outer membrane protein assembly factor BamB family protein [Thermoplasmatota archaeon]